MFTGMSSQRPFAFYVWVERNRTTDNVISRTPWQGDEESLKKIKNAGGKINGDGYVNVAAELGISGARDYSTYHQHWVRRQGFGYY